ncbi:sigma-70 family RNA polymerase sigma factor [Actinomadura gamaensis]|uniref:Sigma-70 family RNA polymerase sigma factor n=1 Tax=Actinomadura gamaensis TaxID=1763541 RepID=A0ABV9U9D6_9ACTN
MSEPAFEAPPPDGGTEASDAGLISRIRQGDLTAFGELYERHVTAARGLAHHLVEGDAAEDAVQDAFAKILDVLQRGGGPQSGFRPYLLTSVRRTVYDRYRGEKRLQSTDQIELFDPGTPFVDPALEGLERSMIVRAFRSLPERWQAVLWHTEIEGAKPAEVAPLLGLTANGVAALAYRAREGLRQAYLQMHLAASYAAHSPSTADAAVGAAGAVAATGLARVARETETAVPPPRQSDAAAVDAASSGETTAIHSSDASASERPSEQSSDRPSDRPSERPSGQSLDQSSKQTSNASASDHSAPARATPRSGVAFTGGASRSESTALSGTAGAAGAAFASTPVVVDEKCRPVLELLGAHVRGGLAKRDTRRVEGHLDDCEDCKALYLELADINTALRESLGPLVLGGAATAYLSAVAKGGVGAGGLWAWLRHIPKRQQQAAGAGAAAAVAVATAALAMGLVSHDRPLVPAPKPPAVAAPVAPAPAAAAPPARHKPQPKPKPPAPKPKPKPKPRPRPPAAKPRPKPKPRPVKRAPQPVKPRPRPKKPPLPVMPPPKFDIDIGPIGALVHDQPGLVGMTVRNAGGRTRDLIADVVLPPDVSYAGASGGRRGALFKSLVSPGDGWSCRPMQVPSAQPPTGLQQFGSGDSRSPGMKDAAYQGPSSATTDGVRCTHAALPQGKKTSAYLHVLVGATAPTGMPPTVTLRSGEQKVAARASWGVVNGGLPARFAADGSARVVSVGNSLASCDENQVGCKEALNRQGEEQDDDFWNMKPMDRDDDPSTKSSSAARLELPKGASVLWAGMYWSGVTQGAPTGPVTARLRGPNGKYKRVRSTEVQSGRLPDFATYQAFADVTKLVRAHGAGVWWGADVPTIPGQAHYAGWSLVVAVKDPAAPLQQVVVLDGPRVLGSLGDHRTDVPLSGLLPAARPAHIGLVGWEGDEGLVGDRLLLDGRPLIPGDGERSADNVFDSSSTGAIGTPLTFGTDVHDFTTVLSRRSTLSVDTDEDALLLGVVTVTAPMRS